MDFNGFYSIKIDNNEIWIRSDALFYKQIWRLYLEPQGTLIHIETTYAILSFDLHT